jgi:hypothetical protein
VQDRMLVVYVLWVTNQLLVWAQCTGLGLVDQTMLLFIFLSENGSRGFLFFFPFCWQNSRCLIREYNALLE